MSQESITKGFVYGFDGCGAKITGCELRPDPADGYVVVTLLTDLGTVRLQLSKDAAQWLAKSLGYVYLEIGDYVGTHFSEN